MAEKMVKILPWRTEPHFTKPEVLWQLGSPQLTNWGFQENSTRLSVQGQSLAEATSALFRSQGASDYSGAFREHLKRVEAGVVRALHQIAAPHLQSVRAIQFITYCFFVRIPCKEQHSQQSSQNDGSILVGIVGNGMERLNIDIYVNRFGMWYEQRWWNNARATIEGRCGTLHDHLGIHCSTILSSNQPMNVPQAVPTCSTEASQTPACQIWPKSITVSLDLYCPSYSS